jgi:hypothetical protein
MRSQRSRACSPACPAASITPTMSRPHRPPRGVTRTTLALLGAFALLAPAAGAKSGTTPANTPQGGAAAPAVGTSTSSPAVTVPTIATTTPASPGTVTTPQSTITVPSTTTAPGATTAPSTTTATVTAARAGKGGGGVSGGAILAAVIAALLALACLAWAVFRLGAFEPHWLLSARHSLAEAGFRAAATWDEFTDWIRLGR